MNIRRLFLILVPLFMLSCTVSKEPWADLFNGRDLEGFVLKGGRMNFSWDKNELVGSPVEGEPNGFLCTNENYRDFILEYEFLPDARLNSGVQIRGQSKTEYLEGRVHGLQVEIDPSARGWSGGLYDESRRGWLCTLLDNEAARAAFRKSDWNKVRIEAFGDTIRTWINNVEAAWLVDNTDTEGFIAFQVHQVRNVPENDTLEVRFRNVRIIRDDVRDYITTARPSIEQVNMVPNMLTSTEKGKGWSLLFDGSSPEGWICTGGESIPQSGWVFENGSIGAVGSEVMQGQMSLQTEAAFSDFELRFEFLVADSSSGGLCFYAPGIDEAKSGFPGLVYSIEGQKSGDKLEGTGSMRGILPASNVFPSPVGQWNNARINSGGKKIEYWLNNLKILDADMSDQKFIEGIVNKYEPGDASIGDGHISLIAGKRPLYFRNIKIRSIKDSK